MWLAGVLNDLSEKMELVTIYKDFLREAEKIVVNPIASKNKAVDFFAKSLGAGRFEELRKEIGISIREEVLTR